MIDKLNSGHLNREMFLAGTIFLDAFRLGHLLPNAFPEYLHNHFREYIQFTVSHHADTNSGALAIAEVNDPETGDVVNTGQELSSIITSQIPRDVHVADQVRTSHVVSIMAFDSIGKTSNIQSAAIESSNTNVVQVAGVDNAESGNAQNTSREQGQTPETNDEVRAFAILVILTLIHSERSPRMTKTWKIGLVCVAKCDALSLDNIF